MKHVFIFDPKAFHNQQWKMDGILDTIGQFFRTQEKPDFSTQISRYRRDAIVLIQAEADKARAGDIVRVYAIGGDEILYDCLNAVAYLPNMQLAAVPHGESSDFLHVFGEGKAENFKEIPALVKAETISTDIMRWGVNYALNSCYIGLNSATAAKLKVLKSKLNKRSFIIFSKITTILNYLFTAFDREITDQQYKIMIDDRDYSGHYSLIHIANGPYHAGKKTGAQDAVPDDGLLDVTLIKSADPLKIMWSMNRYSRGKRSRSCVSLKAKKITVQSDKQMWVQMDNEYFQDTKIDINVVHHAVQMVVPDNLSYPLATISAV